MGISLMTISTRLTLLKYHDILLRLTGDVSDQPSRPSWELEVIGGEGAKGGDGSAGGSAFPKGFQEEEKDLKRKLAEEDAWKARLEEVKGELAALA